MLEMRCCLSTSDAPMGVRIEDNAMIQFEYLNQGGANVIFKINPEPSGAKQQFFFANCEKGSITAVCQQDVIHQVLRVDKGLDKTLRCEEVVSGFYEHVRPLFVSGSLSVIKLGSDSKPVLRSVLLRNIDFTQHLMEHQGVLLYPTVMVDLMSKCDTVLPKGKLVGNQLPAPDRWGILLPDMSSTAGLSVTIEVKPKWLAQSPNAPLNAVRCRTCAMQVSKPKDLKDYVCPLRLLGSDDNKLYQWVLNRVTDQLVEHAATTKQQHQATPITSAIVEYLVKGDGYALLQHLKFLQTQLDPQGVHLRDKTYLRSTFDRNLRLAMTLRDCSLYITAHYTTTGTVKVDSKLGDLDFKSAGKIDDWVSKEQALLKEGAYTKRVKEDLGCVAAR